MGGGTDGGSFLVWDDDLKVNGGAFITAQLRCVSTKNLEKLEQPSHSSNMGGPKSCKLFVFVQGMLSFVVLTSNHGL